MDYIMVKMQSTRTAVPVSHYKGDTAHSVGASNIYLFECETQAKVKITTCTSKLHWKKKIPGSLYFRDIEHTCTASMFSFWCPGLFYLPIFCENYCSMLKPPQVSPKPKRRWTSSCPLALKCLNDTRKKKTLFRASIRLVGACDSWHVLRVTTPNKTWGLSKMCLLRVKVVKSNTQWMEVKACKCWLDENETKLEVWGRYSRYASYFKSFQLCSKVTSFLASADCS